MQRLTDVIGENQVLNVYVWYNMKLVI